MPQVTSYIFEKDDRMRASVAVVLGKMIASQAPNSEVEQAIPHLETLSQDSSSRVRKLAVNALGKVKSDRVIPSLELALKDSDLEVVAIANQSLQNHKRDLDGKGKKAAKTLPANVALKNEPLIP